MCCNETTSSRKTTGEETGALYSQLLGQPKDTMFIKLETALNNLAMDTALREQVSSLYY